MRRKQKCFFILIIFLSILAISTGNVFATGSGSISFQSGNNNDRFNITKENLFVEFGSKSSVIFRFGTRDKESDDFTYYDVSVYGQYIDSENKYITTEATRPYIYRIDFPEEGYTLIKYEVRGNGNAFWNFWFKIPDKGKDIVMYRTFFTDSWKVLKGVGTVFQNNDPSLSISTKTISPFQGYTSGYIDFTEKGGNQGLRIFSGDVNNGIIEVVGNDAIHWFLRMRYDWASTVKEDRFVFVFYNSSTDLNEKQSRYAIDQFHRNDLTIPQKVASGLLSTNEFFTRTKGNQYDSDWRSGNAMGTFLHAFTSDMSEPYYLQMAMDLADVMANQQTFVFHGKLQNDYIMGKAEWSLEIYNITGIEKYKHYAVNSTRHYIDNIVIVEGGCFDRVWSDDYYTFPGLIHSVSISNDGARYNKMIDNIRCHEKVLFGYDIYNRLKAYLHIYSTSATYPHSMDHWGRGEGWVFTSFPLYINYVTNQELKKYLIDNFKTAGYGIIGFQDPSGAWMIDVVDQSPTEGNDLESSATSMISSGLLGAYYLDILDSRALDSGLNGACWILGNVKEDGKIDKTQGGAWINAYRDVASSIGDTYVQDGFNQIVKYLGVKEVANSNTIPMASFNEGILFCGSGDITDKNKNKMGFNSTVLVRDYSDTDKHSISITLEGVGDKEVTLYGLVPGVVYKLNDIKKSESKEYTSSPEGIVKFVASLDTINTYTLKTDTGLNAKYYNGNDADFNLGKYFLNLAVQRTDSQISFNWPGSPGLGVNNDYFTVIWEGFIRIDTPGEYTFYASADDYIKLYISNNPVLEAGQTEVSGKYNFPSAGYYPIKAEYTEWYGGSWVSVSYEGPGITKKIIPPNAFYTINPGQENRPLISDPRPSGSFSISDNSATIQVSTDTDSTCRYSTMPGIAYDQMEVTFQNTGGKTHSHPVYVESGARYNYYVRCSSSNSKNYLDFLLSFETNRAAITHGGYYDGITTNFNDPATNTKSISSLTLEKSEYGAMVFTVPISIKRDVDLKASTGISNRSIYMDSSKLPELNFPALIGFYNTGLNNPEIWMDNIKCPAAECVFIGKYKEINNAYVYQVSHFTNYTLRENCIDNDSDKYNSTGGECGPIDCNDNNPEIYPGRAELCDGIDNNCDKVIDEGCSCTPTGLNRTCGPLNETGICRFGNQTCEGGQWSSLCIGAIYSATEVCNNGLDDDCDGETDEDCSPCRDKDKDKFNVSLDPSKDCGQTDCNDNNPAIYPGAPEVCGNGVDENCDGKDLSCNPDPGPGSGPSPSTKSCTEGNKKYAHGSKIICGTDRGVCDTGIKECDDGKWGECEGQVGPSEEICDGLDNDCDGEIDETCLCVHGTEKPCGSNTGTCREGIQKCVKGSWGACEGDIPPASEDICFNSLDDNCNGEVDEDCKDAIDTCSNGKLDSDEEGIDCGGKCPDKCPDNGLMYFLMVLAGILGMIGVMLYVGYFK